MGSPQIVSEYVRNLPTYLEVHSRLRWQRVRTVGTNGIHHTGAYPVIQKKACGARPSGRVTDAAGGGGTYPTS
ncbi:hypothetical protein GCM10010980_03110 [Corynebacterium marinum]|nr:hypothetical protein GCM10010980_03110 [Corynebacterium marinum]